jgi:RNA polymerase sigma-70 factor (ECF subfamily)
VGGTPEAVAGLASGETKLDLETIFAAQYQRIARVIARVLRDPARAEELAVEVFLKWSRTSAAQGPSAEGWLYRTAVRASLDELRRQTRRGRFEPLFDGARSPLTPEELRSSQEDRDRVRVVLAALPPRQAEMLLLRSDGLSYENVAFVLEMNPASVGTLLSRAQQAFRKEFVKRYGEQ